MQQYWDAFAEKYEKKVKHLGLSDILELFWYYCNDESHFLELLDSYTL